MSVDSPPVSRVQPLGQSDLKPRFYTAYSSDRWSECGATRNDTNLKRSSWHCINLLRKFVPDTENKPDTKSQANRSTLVAAAAFAGCPVAGGPLYKSRPFFSPLALVVVAAIGLAALLLQIRLRPDLSSSPKLHGPLWLNGIGVLFSLGGFGGRFFSRRARMGVDCGIDRSSFVRSQRHCCD